ncbi:TPA: glycoside hydrolase family 99-like domain-containing protein, partial [Shigella boydii]
SYKVFPFYFPQFYATKENDMWWGKGFTDWELVKKAQAVHQSQSQPRIPLNGYYDQSDPVVIKKQSKLASEYGIDGFNFYHYWFDGTVLLDKPMQNLYNDKSIDIEYFFTWANETWTRQWVGRPQDLLIKQEHKVDINIWNEHYEYLRKFFLDDRYLKINNSPVLCIYRPELLKSLREWVAFFNNKAKCDGFDGIHLIALRAYSIANADSVYKYFDKIVNFQPRFAINTHLKKSSPLKKLIESTLRIAPEWLQLQLVRIIKNKRATYNHYKYSDYIQSMKNDVTEYKGKPIYPVVFPDWDNAPRYKENATFFCESSAFDFEKALNIACDITRNHDDKLIFINAWNEWSEGAYLEPDEMYKYSNLEIIKKVFQDKR